MGQLLLPLTANPLTPQGARAAGASCLALPSSHPSSVSYSSTCDYTGSGNVLHATMPLLHKMRNKPNNFGAGWRAEDLDSREAAVQEPIGTTVWAQGAVMLPSSHHTSAPCQWRQIMAHAH